MEGKIAMKNIEYRLQIIKWNNKDEIFPGFDHYTEALDENELHLRKYMFKYLELKEYDVCNIFSKVQERLCIYKGRRYDKANVAKVLLIGDSG